VAKRAPKGGEAQDVSRQAGRGGLAVASAKAYFILAGLVQQTALPRVLGLDGYGALSTVLSTASVAYNPVVTTSIQGVSRAVAGAAPGTDAIVLRRVLAIHVGVATVGAAAFFSLAEPLGRLMGAPHVVPGLRVLALVLLAYGAYAPLIGALNGRRRFVAQASFDVLAATLRTALLIGGAVLFMRGGAPLAGVAGAAWGFAVSTGLVLVFALFAVGVGRAGASSYSRRSHLAFVGRLLFGQAVFNLLLQADLMLLRRFGAEAALRAGLPVTAADGWVGAYRATQLFSFLPYQFLVAVTFVLFPMLASARRDADSAGVARYVENGLRLALLVAGAMVSVTSGLSGPLLRLVFGPEAAVRGAPALEVLSLGFGAFAVLGLLTAVLTGLGRERASAWITFAALALVVLLCFTTVRGAPLSQDLLLRTAISTSLGILIATVSAAVLVRRTAGALVSARSFVRVVLALGVAIAVGRLLPIGAPFWVIPAALGVLGVYAITLLVTGELERSDLEFVLSLATKKK
jgi:stage V sporulation protein B